MGLHVNGRTCGDWVVWEEEKERVHINACREYVQRSVCMVAVWDHVNYTDPGLTREDLDT